MRVMGAASEGRSSAQRRYATDSDIDIEPCAAVGLDQRSCLQLLLFKKNHKLRLQLCSKCEYCLMIKPRMDVLWRKQDMCVVVGPKPLFSHVAQGRISPDENTLLFSGQESTKTMGDRVSDTSGLALGRTSVQQEYAGQCAREREGQADAASLFHKTGL